MIGFGFDRLGKLKQWCSTNFQWTNIISIIPTCQIWLLLRRCGRCSGAHAILWPTVSHLSLLLNGVKMTQWGAHSILRETSWENIPQSKRESSKHVSDRAPLTSLPSNYPTPPHFPRVELGKSGDAFICETAELKGLFIENLRAQRENERRPSQHALQRR